MLDELARYRAGHIACDPAISGLRVVGSFPLNDTDRAPSMLAASLPVRIEQMAPWLTSVLAR